MYRNIIILCKMTGILLLFLIYGSNNISIQCIIKKVTNIPCVGCGSTRAIRLIIKGDVFNALYQNPLTVILFIIFFIILIISVKDVIFKTYTAYKILYIQFNKIEYTIIICIFIINWVFNIIKFK